MLKIHGEIFGEMYNCSHVLQSHGSQLSNGGMPLLPFQNVEYKTR